ncbi:hypothetical protein J7337_000356 [Fusarium musae]|uniref:Uncharacterized protein n=1 Tax=Fusarium musae TaxID=1042133 RepID=A0A9P8DR64_9HYPO|nr:hypothetical protein J7337_000356 [Fusarium musae]KAG9506814.1 hypothetical protein J7337_000356 [Fusarium musae]
MQNPEASSLDILETTENTDDVSGAVKKNGNSIDNDSPPAKKKSTSKNRIPIKDKPQWPKKATSTFVTLKVVSRPPFRLAVFVDVCVGVDARPVLTTTASQPVGEAAELGKQLQNFARHIADSQSVSLRPFPHDVWYADSLKAGDRATQAEWFRRATATKASFTAIQEMPSVAPGQESQSVSEESEPAPSSNSPAFDDIQPVSNIPPHPIQSGQHHMASSQGMSVPGSFAAPQNPPVFQDIPADGFMDPQGHPFQDISQDGPGPYNNQPQCPFRRLESALNRIAAGVEANNSLMQQILASGDRNINNPINFNR